MGLDASILSALTNAKVLVVGDTMLDRYWFGSVDRISPEAPVPVVAVNDEQERVGGAANVARNVSDATGKATLVSIVGKDVAGLRVKELLVEAGIKSALTVDDSIRTTVKLRVIARNQQLIRVDFEDLPQADSLHSCLSLFKQELPHHQSVVFSDYGKGGLSYVSEMLKSCNEAGVFALVDPKSSDFSLYSGADLITPNLKEFQAVVGPVWEIDEIDKAAQKLMRDHSIGAVLITLSERGMVLCRPSAPALIQSTRAREVFDVTGAGDTVIGIMALCVASDVDIEQAMSLANHAAGVVVSKIGTATATVDELLESIQIQ